MKALDRINLSKPLDNTGGVIRTHTHDEASGTSFIHSVQDIAPFKEANREMRNSGGDGYTGSRAMKHVATIPHIMIDKWCQEDGLTRVQFQRMRGKEKAAYIRRKLNNPDYAYMRTFWKG